MKNESRHPTISIIIPTFNRVQLLKRSIDSVLSQTIKDFELIVIDDSPSHATKEAIEEFHDKRIIYLRPKKRQGIGAARNMGIGNSKGKYIAFLDDDDFWHPEKLEKQIEELAHLESNRWGGIYCSYIRITKKGAHLNIATEKGDLTERLLALRTKPQPMSTGLFRKEAIYDTGFFNEALSRQEDVEFMVRFFRRYEIGFVKEPLVTIDNKRKRSHKLGNFAMVKQRFLESVKEDIERLGPDAASRIYARHWLAVARNYSRIGERRKSLLYLRRSIDYRILPIGEYLEIPVSFIRRASIC